jgi:hypothetical protein
MGSARVGTHHHPIIHPPASSTRSLSFSFSRSLSWLLVAHSINLDHQPSSSSSSTFIEF